MAIHQKTKALFHALAQTQIGWQGFLLFVLFRLAAYM
jgi:hypothetical protein